MSETFSFGSYVPGDSVLHRLDPRTKLLLGLALVVVIPLTRGLAPLAPAALAVAALYAAGRIPPAKALRSLAPTLVIVALVSLLRLFTQQGGDTLVNWWFIKVSEGGVYEAALAAVRLTLMMMAMGLVTLTTRTLDLTEALERLLSPLARLGVPAHELGMMMGIALRFMPQLAGELHDTYQAQVSRGARLGTSPVRGVRMLSSVAIPLFAGVFRHAETLSQAMDARCYHGEAGRTRLHPLRLHRRDGVAAGLFSTLLAGMLALSALVA